MKKGRGVGYVAAFYHLHGADDSAVYVYCDGISFFPDSCSGRKDAVAAGAQGECFAAVCLVGLVLSGVLGITAHVATADDPSVFVMVLMVVSVVELVTEWLDDTTSDLDDDVSGSVFWSGARWKEFDQELGVLMLLFPPEVFNHPAVVVRLGPLLRVRQDRDGFI